MKDTRGRKRGHKAPSPATAVPQAGGVRGDARKEDGGGRRRRVRAQQKGRIRGHARQEVEFLGTEGGQIKYRRLYRK